MESKTFLFIIVGLVLGTGGTFLVRAFQEESLKHDLQKRQLAVATLQQGLTQAHDTIARNTQLIEQANASTNAYLTANQRALELEGEVNRHTKLLEGARSKWDVNVQMMQEALGNVRTAFGEVTVPQIPMKNGDAIKDCHFSVCKEGTALFMHSSGTSRLTAAQLPPDLADRLRPDFPPALQLPVDPDAPTISPQPGPGAEAGPDALTKILNDPHAPVSPGPMVASANPTAKGSRAATPQHSAPPPQPSNPVAEAYQAKQTAIQNLKMEMSASQRELVAYQRMVGQANNPSDREKANAAVRSLQNQIKDADERIRQLQNEMGRLAH